MIVGKRYSELAPEQIARERARKRLSNRKTWVALWWARIQAETKGDNMARNEDGSVKDDGTLSGYYASRRENRLADQAKRDADAAAKDKEKR